MKQLLILLAIAVGWAAPAMAYEFDHAVHLEILDGTSCDTCHVAESEAIIPPESACLECHDQEFVNDVEYPMLKTHGPAWTLNHRPYAKIDDYDCASCHQQQDCFECHTDAGRADEMGELGNEMFNVHRSDFHVTHPLAARTNPQLCSSCHESRYCTECHDAFNLQGSDIGGLSHRRTFDLGLSSDFGDISQIHANLIDPQQASLACDSCHVSGSVATDFHDWSTGHAREARKDLNSCQACHPQGDVCIKCHSANGGVVGFNPHPKDWNDIKNRLDRASDGKTCRKCH